MSGDLSLCHGPFPSRQCGVGLSFLAETDLFFFC